MRSWGFYAEHEKPLVEIRSKGWQRKRGEAWRWKYWPQKDNYTEPVLGEVLLSVQANKLQVKLQFLYN